MTALRQSWLGKDYWGSSSNNSADRQTAVVRTKILWLLCKMKFVLSAWIVLICMAVFAAATLASDNGANDYLLTLTPSSQAKMLGKVASKDCKGKLAIYQGSVGDHAPGPNDAPIIPGHEHDSIWSVKYTNGKSYSVSVHPKGDSQVLECSVLEAIHGGHCFKKFP